MSTRDDDPTRAPGGSTTTPEQPGDAGEGDAPASSSRRDVLKYGGLLVGGAALGAIAGYAVASSSDDGGGSGETGDTAAKVLSIGTVIARTSQYLGSSQEAVRGLEMAVKTINDRGGLAKKEVQLVVQEVDDLSEASMQQAANALVAEGVVGAFLPFTSATCAEFGIYGEHKAPVFHVSQVPASLDAVANDGLTNIFRCIPRALGYGPRFAALLRSVRVPAIANGPTAIVTSEDGAALGLAEAVQASLDNAGIEVATTETSSTPLEDAPALVEALTQADVGSVFLGILSSQDAAAFQTAFAEAPFPALIYVTAAPGVPEYVELAGEAANGVVWSTPIGTITDTASEEYLALYEKKYKRPAGMTLAGATFDMVSMWSQAAALAKSPTKLGAVEKVIPELLYRGVSGTFDLSAEDHVVAGFPGGTKDPALGIPHLTYQVQDGLNLLISPDRYATGGFETPSWI